MKPNVTIRIQCPGAEDVDPKTYEGQTVNFITALHENSFGPYISIGSSPLALPPHIFGAFKAMLESTDSNRIEIMQGITKYSCYRQPQDEQKIQDRKEAEYKAGQMKTFDMINFDMINPDAVDPLHSSVSKVCFDSCPDKKEDENYCDGCPLGDVDGQIRNAIQAKRKEVVDMLRPGSLTCGNACPYPVTCRKEGACRGGLDHGQAK